MSRERWGWRLTGQPSTTPEPETILVHPVKTPKPHARRRRGGGGGVVAMGALGAVVTGVGTWLGLGALLDQDLSPTEQLEEWDRLGLDEAVNPIPTPWVVDWDAHYEQEVVPYTPGYLEAPEVFDDGLDHANLPPLVERTSPSYPEAHLITDEIWDAAGPGWMLATYNSLDMCRMGLAGDKQYSSEYSPVLDLVSPEGVHFRLPAIEWGEEVGAKVNAYDDIRYANLAEGWAIVEVSESTCLGDWVTQGTVMVDLRTGKTGASVVYEEDIVIEDAGVFLAVGPLVGGAEVRLLHHRNEPPTPDDGLFIWTPEEGAVAVGLPEEVSLGDLAMLGIADADAGIVALYVPEFWAAEPSGRGFAERVFLLDVTTSEVREVFPATVEWAGERSSLIDATATGMVVQDLALNDEGGLDPVRALMIPWDGTEPTEIPVQEAFELDFERFDLIPMIECDKWDCVIASVEDATGIELVPPLPTAYSWVSQDVFITPWGDGVLTVRGGPDWPGWPGVVVEFDPTTGTRFDPLPYWVPDTAAKTGLTDVFVFSAPPEGERP